MRSRPEGLHKALTGPQREGPDELAEIEHLGGAENRFRLLNEVADPLAEFERPRGGNQAAPGPDQQGIARRLAQPRQRPAHRRRTEPQPFGGARHAAFRQQDIQGDQQIEIGSRHGATIS